MKLYGGLFEEGILTFVFDITQRYLPYNKGMVDRIARPYYGDQEIPLNTFIQQRAGICKHQALLAAYLLERLKREGYTQGKVSVDRNYIKNIGGHAWVRYINSYGDIYIIDPAIDPATGYIGLLNDISGQRWFYERPEESLQRLSSLQKLIYLLKIKLNPKKRNIAFR